jgi:hypothetical protein
VLPNFLCTLPHVLPSLLLSLIPSFLSFLVQNLLAFSKQIPTLVPTMLMSSTKHPQNATQKETCQVASHRWPISGGHRPGPHHRGSHHPNYPHTPNKPTTHIHRIPCFCYRHEEARGPNRATIDPSGGDRNQHHRCGSPTFVVIATTTPQSRPTSRSQSSR